MWIDVPEKLYCIGSQYLQKVLNKSPGFVHEDTTKIWIFLAYKEQQETCWSKKYLSEVDIPLEMKFIRNDLNAAEFYLEIVVKYQDKFDLYVSEEEGFVRYVELQMPHRPNYSWSDYSNKIM